MKISRTGNGDFQCTVGKCIKILVFLGPFFKIKSPNVQM